MNARHKTRVSHLLAAMLMFHLVSINCTAPAAEVTVKTNQGQVLEGQVDSRTSQKALWVRHEEEGIVLVTAVDWSRITAVAIGGQEIEGPVNAVLPALATRAPEGLLSEYGPPPEVVAHLQGPGFVPSVTNLEIDAVLTNSDRDTEDDGYDITLAAVNECGETVPVQGTLTARLLGEKTDDHLGRVSHRVLQQWSQPVTPADFRDGVATYLLPFRSFYPERDDEFYPVAELEATLGVFGQGNYSAAMPVPLWRFSPYRDRLQLEEGSRFFRDQVSTGVRHVNTSLPGVYRQVWSH